VIIRKIFFVNKYNTFYLFSILVKRKYIKNGVAAVGKTSVRTFAKNEYIYRTENE